MRTRRIRIIGGGLAGPEAALQAAKRGCEVDLYEMRPTRSTEAHQTSDFAELVCSNSLKSESENTAPWLLKQEMRRAGSILLAEADATAVPAGHALAVDRVEFSKRVAARVAAETRITVHREEVTCLKESDDTLTILASGPLTSPALAAELQRLTGSDHLAFYDSISPIVDASTIDINKVYFAARIAAEPRITVHREEVTTLQEDNPDTITVLASGPLTSPALTAELQRLTGSEHLAFYDSISPIVDASTIDMDKVYLAARWDKGTADYINCPFTKEEYETFLDALTTAENVEAKDWEKFPVDGTANKLQYFEGCLPIEETARRGRDTLRFGPMKPVGLTDPKTGRWPYAVVQLRQENLRADSYNLVGFQNHLKYGEQARVLRLIPGLERATFLRYGQIHRNTYIHAPSLLTETLQLKAHPSILIAGQLSGVEGYTESIASGMLAGRYAAALAHGNRPIPVPRASANGSLTHYITHAEQKKFTPANITFDLLPPLETELRKKMRDKKERHKLQCDRALAAWDIWLQKQ